MIKYGFLEHIEWFDSARDCDNFHSDILTSHWILTEYLSAVGIHRLSTKVEASFSQKWGSSLGKLLNEISFLSPGLN